LIGTTTIAAAEVSPVVPVVLTTVPSPAISTTPTSISILPPIPIPVVLII
jgi:hypothetical protein